MLSLDVALAAGPLVLDGGLSTELKTTRTRRDLPLWSARLLRDDPVAMVATHAAFAAAGAQVATTASYQATVEGSRMSGRPRDEARRLIAWSVALAREEPGRRLGRRLGGPTARCSPTARSTPAPTSRPLDLAALRECHRPRMELLAEAGADLLACEAVPAAAKAEALIAEADALGVPIWLSLTTVVDGDGVVRTRRGEPADEVLAMAAVDAVIAVGVNCAVPAGIGPTVAAAAVAGKPIVVYPNSGEGWDAVGRRWTGSPGISTDDVPTWVDAGARLIGGCCRVRPEHIAAIAAAVR